MDLDNGQRKTDERFQAFQVEHGITLGQSINMMLHYVSMPKPTLALTDEKSKLLQLLIKKILDKNIKFVIIDHLGLLSRNADENSNEMTGVMDCLRQLVKDTGAAVGIIHHENKAGGYSGYHGILSAVDLALHVKVNSNYKNKNIIQIDALATRGAEIEDFGVVFNYNCMENIKELINAKFLGTPTDDTNKASTMGRKPKAIDNRLENAITTFIQDAKKGQVERTQIIKKFVTNEITEYMVKKALIELEKRDILYHKGGGGTGSIPIAYGITLNKAMDNSL